MYDQPTGDILLNGKIQQTFPLKSGTRQGAHPIAFIDCSTWTFSQTRKRRWVSRRRKLETPETPPETCS